jgi:hypothetical protein
MCFTYKNSKCAGLTWQKLVFTFIEKVQDFHQKGVATSQLIGYLVHTWANITDYACKHADMLMSGVIFSVILETVH